MGKVGRFVKCLGAVLMAVAALAVTAQPAVAEDELLVASDPYKHQELSDPPSGVVLAFNRAVDAAAAQIIVTNSAGKNVTVNSLIVEGTNVTAQVKPNLPKGTYTVHYQVDRKDGEVEGGAFQFSYGTGEWTTLSDEKWSGNSAQPTEISSVEPDPPTETPVATETPTATASASGSAPTPTETSAAPMPVSGGADPAPWLWGGAAVILAAGAGAIAWRRSVSRRG